MYKLFIVDDEPLVREGLSSSINWEEIGFTVVGEASNGLDALTQIEHLLPDVVITDMRMGVMDGSELISNIKKNYPDIQIIIMTAYNEFSYAKTAIDNHIFAYICKPTPNREIIATFCRLYEKMTYDRNIKDKLQSYQAYRADDLLTQLIHTTTPKDETILALRNCLDAGTAQHDYFMAQIEIYTGKPVCSPEHIQQLSMVLNERLSFYLSINKNCIYKCKQSSTEIILLIFTQTHDFREQTAFLEELNLDFADKTDALLTIGVSATFRSLSYIHRAYQQTQEALRHKSQVGPGRLIDFMSVSKLHKETPIFSTQDIHNTLACLLAEDREGVDKIIANYFHSLADRNADIAVVKSGMIELCTTVIRKIFKNSYTLQLIFGNPLRPADDIQTQNTIGEISQYISKFMERLLLTIHYMKPVLVPQEQYSPIVNRAISYIAGNYAQTVKIPDISAKLHISESRLIHIFKEETGKTINDFLTEYRIHLAEVMIHTDYYKLYDIATLIGYNNPITFRKAFIRVTGTIPSKYQQQGGFDELP